MDELEPTPLDSPAHRWELIVAMAREKHAPSRTVEDRLLREGYQFLQRIRKGKYYDLPLIQGDYPDLYRAWSMFKDLGSVRWLVEAGLLAGVPMEELGAYVGQEPSVVVAYSEFYFDVRKKLPARGYILSQVLYPAIYRGLDQRDFDFLYKTLSYCAGWKVFTEFVDVRKMSPDTEEWLKASFKDRVFKLGWLAAHRVNVNNFNAVELIEKCIDLMRLEREGDPALAKDQAVILVRNLLSQCKMTMIPASEILEPNEPRTLGMYVRPEAPAPAGGG
jgi:hypothetical protein